MAINTGMCALLLHLSVSGMALTYAGDPYISDGGSPVWKIHPGSYLSYAAALAALLDYATGRQTAWQHIWARRNIVISAIFLAICVLYEAVLTGLGNPIVLIDTFLPACMLAFVFTGAHTADRNRLRRLLQLAFAINALIAVAENITQTHLIPPILDGHLAYESDQEFRATALYDHPLTGSTASVMGLLMAGAMPGRARRLCYQLLMGAALIAFGGRVALGIGLLSLLWLQARSVIGAILHRSPSAPWLVLATCGSIVTVTGIAGLALAAGLGARLQSHFYWDPSAQVRLAQWHVLEWLTPAQWLFGCPRPDQILHLRMLSLGYGVDVIENFWLLMFVSLGMLGFPLFLAGLMGLLLWCWRQSDQWARATMLAFMLIASTSNSLGRKSPLLLLLVATIVSSTTNIGENHA